MCACLEHSARQMPGSWPMLATHDPAADRVNGSLAVLTGRSADSFEYQMLRGIWLAFRRLLLRAGESPARGYMALPQALRTAISAIAGTRASGRLARVLQRWAFDFEPAIAAVEALGDGRRGLLDSQVPCR